MECHNEGTYIPIINPSLSAVSSAGSKQAAKEVRQTYLPIKGEPEYRNHWLTSSCPLLCFSFLEQVNEVPFHRSFLRRRNVSAGTARAAYADAISRAVAIKSVAAFVRVHTTSVPRARQARAGSMIGALAATLGIWVTYAVVATAP